MTDIASTAHGPGGLFSNPALGSKPLRKCKSARLRAEKQATFGGTPRKDLPDSAFIDPDKRSFPVMTAQDVRDAVSSWGRYTGSLTFEQFKERLTRRARAIGAADALPEKWSTKAETTYTPPASARNNARKVLEWRKKYGSQVKGMTRVGWGRARQLASGKPISLDIVKRMAQFARHQKNAAVAPEYENEPWRDAGYVAWLGWGGSTGIDWARNISGAANTREKAVGLDAYTPLGTPEIRQHRNRG